MMPLRPQFETEEEWVKHLRIWFAGKAMSGIVGHIKYNSDPNEYLKRLVKSSYDIADKMVAWDKRKKENSDE